MALMKASTPPAAQVAAVEGIEAASVVLKATLWPTKLTPPRPDGHQDLLLLVASGLVQISSTQVCARKSIWIPTDFAFPGRRHCSPRTVRSFDVCLSDDDEESKQGCWT